ncbi:MAG: DsbA family protein [Gaiellaceae bacterium]
MHRNRLLLLAGAVAVAAIVVIVLIAAGSGGDSKSPNAPTTGSTTTALPSNPFAGVPQHGETLGRADAAATLTVFEDPQCPFCREWSLGTLPSVIQDFVRTGQVALVYRGIEIIGPNSQKGLRAIYAAGRQNKLWNLSEALYRRQGDENSGWITDAVIRDAAHAAGANADAILAASGSAPVTNEWKQAEEDAQTDAVQGTPAFIVQRPPALPQTLNLPSLDVATFESALSAALQ